MAGTQKYCLMAKGMAPYPPLFGTGQAWMVSMSLLFAISEVIWKRSELRVCLHTGHSAAFSPAEMWEHWGMLRITQFWVWEISLFVASPPAPYIICSESSLYSENNESQKEKPAPRLVLSYSILSHGRVFIAPARLEQLPFYSSFLNLIMISTLIWRVLWPRSTKRISLVCLIW